MHLKHELSIHNHFHLFCSIIWSHNLQNLCYQRNLKRKFTHSSTWPCNTMCRTRHPLVCIYLLVPFRRSLLWKLSCAHVFHLLHFAIRCLVLHSSNSNLLLPFDMFAMCSNDDWQKKWTSTCKSKFHWTACGFLTFSLRFWTLVRMYNLSWKLQR